MDIPPNSPRPKQMKVLCVGLSRNATKSTYDALKQLGYTPYHAAELLTSENRKNQHIRCWYEGLSARLYGTGKLYGRPEFDRLLGQYDAVTDCPCANFALELAEAYPDAKVILQTRDPDSWVKSMVNSYYRVESTIEKHPGKYLDIKLWTAFNDNLRLILNDITGGKMRDLDALRKGYLEHNERVRTMIPKERFLEFHPKDGWEPLCKHLNQPVPSTPFPRVNEGSTLANWVMAFLTINFVLLLAIPSAGVWIAWVAWKYWAA